MSNLRKGFFPAPRKENGKQQNLEETKKLQKTTMIQQRLPRRRNQEIDEVSLTPGGYRIQYFWTDEHGTGHNVVLNLLQDVKKLPIENIKLKEQIQYVLQDKLDFKMVNQEKKIYTLWKSQQAQKCLTKSQVQQIQSQNKQLEIKISSQQQIKKAEKGLKVNCKMEIEEMR